MSQRMLSTDELLGDDIAQRESDGEVVDQGDMALSQSLSQGQAAQPLAESDAPNAGEQEVVFWSGWKSARKERERERKGREGKGKKSRNRMVMMCEGRRCVVWCSFALLMWGFDGHDGAIGLVIAIEGV